MMRPRRFQRSRWIHSETYDSEFDDSDDKSDSDAECSGSSEVTVDYSY